jgi:hypothetical protein
VRSRNYLRAGRSGFRIQVGAEDFSFLQNRPYWMWGPPNLLFSGNRGSLKAVKRSGSETDGHSPPSIAEVKNEWSYSTFALPCHNGVDKDNFTLT